MNKSLNNGPTTAARDATDVTPIIAIVAQARRRLRLQGALEGITTASIAASAFALWAIFGARSELFDSGIAWSIVGVAVLTLIAGAVIGSWRVPSAERIARRVDRSSNLADRLSTAIAFATGKVSSDEQTQRMRQAAIADALSVVGKAKVVEATPFRRPKDTFVALGFIAISALAGGIALPAVQPAIALQTITPDHAPPGAVITVSGRGFGSQPANARVVIGVADQQLDAAIVKWTSDILTIQIPKNAQLGDSAVTLWLGARTVGSLPLVIVDPSDQRFHADDAVALDEADKAYIKSVLNDLKTTAQQDNASDLKDFVAKVEKMLEMAERGEITKEQMLEELKKAQEAMQANPENKQAEVDKQIADTGKQLQKEPLTKPLGDALAKNDLSKAKEELEKLADKLDKNELTPEQQQKLSEQLKDAAKQFDKKQEQDQKQQQDQRQKMEDEIRKLEKERDQTKDQEQREDAERRLDKKKDELKKLTKDQQEKQDSAQREAVKRLHRDMDKAAESLQKKDQQSQQEQQEQRQQGSQKLKEAARETGAVDQEQRKQATQKKIASQMEDLKEAMRRAKQNGSKGPKDPFNKQGKQRDFAQRASGQGKKGNAWKPGQGQGQGKDGKGQGKDGKGQGGQGDNPGGDGYGDGHDEDMTGDATSKSGDTKEQDLQGAQGKGPSRRETILAAAQKGFASTAYSKVYGDYQRIFEEVMRTEKVPSAYKYYVKRYFTQIHPSGQAAPPAPTAPSPATGAP
jgi:hypothetical protein